MASLSDGCCAGLDRILSIATFQVASYQVDSKCGGFHRISRLLQLGKIRNNMTL